MSGMVSGVLEFCERVFKSIKQEGVDWVILEVAMGYQFFTVEGAELGLRVGRGLVIVGK